jgi:hypothetical protein
VYEYQTYKTWHIKINSAPSRKHKWIYPEK